MKDFMFSELRYIPSGREIGAVGILFLDNEAGVVVDLVITSAVYH